jgi:hypothetical protein
MLRQRVPPQEPIMLCLNALLIALAAIAPEFADVQCAGRYPKHLQGICTDDAGAIYWSFTTRLVRTDGEGNVTHDVQVADHHGDLCFANERIYVAVNLGQFNQPAGKADSWVYVYDARDLTLLARHAVAEVVHGAGGMGVRQGHFYVVGGLPANVDENYVYQYTSEFEFVRRHVISSGHTHLGIQTAAFANGKWWFGCYGTPAEMLVTDADFKLRSRHAFDCALGVVGLPNGDLLVASGRCDGQAGCDGRATVHRAEDDRLRAVAGD